MRRPPLSTVARSPFIGQSVMSPTSSLESLVEQIRHRGGRGAEGEASFERA